MLFQLLLNEISPNFAKLHERAARVQFAQFGEIEFNYSEKAREEVLFLANWIYYQSKSTYYSIKTVYI